MYRGRILTVYLLTQYGTQAPIICPQCTLCSSYFFAQLWSTSVRRDLLSFLKRPSLDPLWKLTCSITYSTTFILRRLQLAFPLRRHTANLIPAKRARGLACSISPRRRINPARKRPSRSSAGAAPRRGDRQSGPRRPSGATRPAARRPRRPLRLPRARRQVAAMAAAMAPAAVACARLPADPAAAYRSWA